jgi:YbbR domain-containing protein
MRNLPRKISRKLNSNIGFKILSVIIAAIIWYVIQGDETLEITRRLDISFEPPQGLAIREGTTVSRDVTLRGPRVALSNFSNKPIQAFYKLPNGRRGTQKVRIDKDMILNWDKRIRVTVHDPYVSLFLDERASKSVPVKIALFGSPKAGLSILDVTSDPVEVTVTGLKSDVQKLNEINTEVIDINNLSESKSFPVPLSISSLSDFEFSVQQVVVHVNLSLGTASKTFDSVSLEIVGSDKLTSIRPEQVAVVVQGPAELVSKLSTKDIIATVDAKDFAPGRYQRRVIVKSPPRISVTNVTPAEIKLEIYNQKKIN